MGNDSHTDILVKILEFQELVKLIQALRYSEQTDLKGKQKQRKKQSDLH